MTNISFSTTQSSSVDGIKRPREEEHPHYETNKKIKTATKDLFSTMPTEIITKILSHLDGISLVRFSETAKKYKSLIDQDKYLSAKILFDNIYSYIINFSTKLKLKPNNDFRDLLFSMNLNIDIACSLIRANHSKAFEVFLKEMRKTSKSGKYSLCFDALKSANRGVRLDYDRVLTARLRLFEALALAKHPRAEEFIPPINAYVNLPFEYAATLVKSKLPKASLLFQRTLDLATKGQSIIGELHLISRMAEFKHPGTDKLLLRAIDYVEKTGDFRYLTMQMIKIKDPRAIKFCELFIKKSRNSLSTILELFEVSIKSKHAKATEFLEQRAINLLEQMPLDIQLPYLKDLSLIMVQVNPTKAIELFQRFQDHLNDERFLMLMKRKSKTYVFFSQEFIDEVFGLCNIAHGDKSFYLLKTYALIKMSKALAMANHQRTDEFFQSAIESANQMKDAESKIFIFCKLSEAKAVKNPSEAFNMMQHTINILENTLSTNFSQRLLQKLFPNHTQISLKQEPLLKNIAWTFAKILSQVADQLHKMNEAKPKR